MLLNGDSWLDFCLLDLPHSARNWESDAVLTLRQLPDASRSGVVTLEGSRVTSFLERPAAPGPGLVNAGIYWLNARILSALPANGSLEHEILPALSKQGRLRGIVVKDGYFIDIGIAETFQRAQSEIPDLMRRRDPDVFLWRTAPDPALPRP